MNSENSRAAATPSGDVGGDRAGQHDPAAAGRALHEPPDRPAAPRTGASAHSTEAIAQTSVDPMQQAAAAPGVGQRTEHELPDDAGR